MAMAMCADEDSSVAAIGILGGTFNPPHIGHLLCAQEACDRLGLDRVMLMPVHTPPHKPVVDDPGAAERVALCRAAVAGDERFAVSTLEADRPGPSYTADTLRRLHEDAPQNELTFIVGGDMALSLPTWREPEEILRLARLAVAERGAAHRADIATRLEPLADPDRIAYFELPRVDVSSTDIRRRVAEGRPIRWLVPDAVAERIAAEGLYRGAATEALA
jgi:nicotinate-nucleotide adenylyltransferase